MGKTKTLEQRLGEWLARLIARLEQEQREEKSAWSLGIGSSVLRLPLPSFGFVWTSWPGLKRQTKS